MIAPDPQVWPVSIAGWVALFSSIIALAGMIFGLGKFFGKLEALMRMVRHLEGTVTQLKSTIDTLEDRFTVMEHVLMGPLKNNGLVSKVTQLGKRVDLIQERNTRIDAVNARERGAQSVGVESRQFNRREEDKIIRGEEDA